MATNVNSLVLSACECSRDIIAPISLPENNKDYVELKKTFMRNYYKELKLHSSVGDKPCYGKQLAQVSTLSSIFSSHKKDLKRLKEHISKTEEKTKKRQYIDLPRKKVSIPEYINSFLSLTSSFENILTTFYKPEDIVPIKILVDSANANCLTLSVFEKSISHSD